MSVNTDFLKTEDVTICRSRMMHLKIKSVLNSFKVLGIVISLPFLLWYLSVQNIVPGRQYISQENVRQYWYAANRKLTGALLPVETQLPIIFVITPTYYRLTQIAELTRLSNTLSIVKNLHWIVVEDFKSTNQRVQELLESSGMSFTYLSKQRSKNTTKRLKGAEQRNTALQWIMEHHRYSSSAVVYFADDDNAYNTKIFQEMRNTKKLSMWPVGFSGGRTFEAPILKDGRVIKFDAWKATSRKFAIDMAGFAINAKVLWDYHPMRFDLSGEVGWQETAFLEKCCTLEEIEPLADNCTKVLIWHTKTAKPNVWKYGDLEV